MACKNQAETRGEGMKLDVACLGIVVADVIAVPVEKYPERGRLVLTERMSLSMGGCAANSAVGMARLGLKVALIAKVGQDALGDFCLRVLEAEGVRAEAVRRDRTASTSSTMVMVHPDRERSFIHCVGANGTFREEDIDFGLIRQAKVLNVGGALLMPGFDGPPLARAIAKGKQMGAITVMDTAWDGTGQWMKLLAEAFPHVDYLLPSFEEAAMLSGESRAEAIAGRLVEAGAKVVVLKMGEKGCYVASEQENFYLPPFEVEMVDSTGAGDAFVAGFVTGLVKGLDLRGCAEMGNAVGALCVTRVGTTEGLPTLDEVESLIGRSLQGRNGPGSG